MTPVDEYLAQVRSAMAGMEPGVRDDILLELRSHLSEAAASDGGDASRALAGMGPPLQVGREYRKVYGYGRLYKALFVSLAALLAVLSSPVLTVGPDGAVPNVLSLPSLIVLVVWLLWVSVAGGSRVGLEAGLAAFGIRVAVAGALAALNPGSTAELLGGVFFATSGVVLVLIGWLPGTAKKTWTRPGAEL